MTKIIDSKSCVLIFIFIIVVLFILVPLVDDHEMTRIAVGLVIGFALQYFLFYSLRWSGLLSDIDRIFLPRDASLVEIASNYEECLSDLPGDNMNAPS